MEKRAQAPKSGIVAAVIPAAGAGIRMEADRPKQFLYLDHRPILAVTLEAFEHCPVIEAVFLVVPGEDVSACEQDIVRRHGLTKVQRVLPGGERRQDSVRLGVEACPMACDFVVVHDGVRPLVQPGLIQRTVAEAREYGAAVAALPARETVKEVSNGAWVERTLARENLWLVQTPQTFRRSDLLHAHHRAMDGGWGEVPDDASLLERLGLPVRIVQGAEDNIKVTTPNDLAVARFLLERRKSGGSSL